MKDQESDISPGLILFKCLAPIQIRVGPFGEFNLLVQGFVETILLFRCVRYFLYYKSPGLKPSSSLDIVLQQLQQRLVWKRANSVNTGRNNQEDFVQTNSVRSLLTLQGLAGLTNILLFNLLLFGSTEGFWIIIRCSVASSFCFPFHFL